MKKIVVMAGVAVAAMSVFAQMSLSDAQGKISEAVNDAAVMTSTVKELSAADQVKFVAAVNEAIAKLPGSAEAKAKKFLAANRAAAKAAAPGNLSAIVAETFATVPVEVLPTIAENYAADFFNRAADPSVTYTDEQYSDIATKMMKIITERTAKADEGDTRAALAAAMLVQAANSPSQMVIDAIAATLPETIREKAKNELLIGDAKNYDAVIGERNYPNPVSILATNPTVIEAMLHDVVQGNTEVYDAIFNPMRTNTPILDQVLEAQKPDTPVEETKEYQKAEESQGYQNQY